MPILKFLFDLMKITISPSEDQDGQKHKYFGVTIEHPHDDVNCRIALEMCVNALMAWGFERDCIMDAMEQFER